MASSTSPASTPRRPAATEAPPAFWAAHLPRYLGELVGTYVLVFVATGVVVANVASEGVITHVGVAIATGLALAARLAYLARLFPALRMASHVALGLAPTVPAVLGVLAFRALAGGGEGARGTLAEVALFCALAAGATLLAERRLLRESVSYLRASARVSPPPTPIP